MDVLYDKVLAYNFNLFAILPKGLVTVNNTSVIYVTATSEKKTRESSSYCENKNNAIIKEYLGKPQN